MNDDIDIEKQSLGAGRRIEAPELSIVVQGPIKETTDERGHATILVLQAARKHYPAAEIVYSGWEGHPLPASAGELVDRVVLSTDPGPVQTFDTADGPVVENINRQIVSTTAGLNAATGRFAVKLRSDTLIVENRFDQWTRSQDRKPGQATQFVSPVIAASQYTRLFFLEYGGLRKCIGHLSDLFFFGRREDLLRFWAGPLVSPEPIRLSRRQDAATPEQVLTIRFLSLRGALPPGTRITGKFTNQVSGLAWKGWLTFLAGNFVVMTDAELGVRHPSRFARLGLSRIIFESDPSIAAAAGTEGLGPLLRFYALKALLYLEYQAKFAVRRGLGAKRFEFVKTRMMQYGIRRRRVRDRGDRH